MEQKTIRTHVHMCYCVIWCNMLDAYDEIKMCFLSVASLFYLWGDDFVWFRRWIMVGLRLWAFSFCTRIATTSIEFEAFAFISSLILDCRLDTSDIFNIYLLFYWYVLWIIFDIFILFSEQLRDTHRNDHDEIKKIVTSNNISTSACVATALTTSVVGYVHSVRNMYTNFLL